MSVDIGYKAIDYFVFLSEGASVLDFTLTGGEPLLDFALIEAIISYAIKKANNNGMGAKISIKTNGTLIKPKHIDLFKKYKCTVFISIDGSENVHDSHRLGNNESRTYAQILDNLKMLTSNNIPLVASMTVHPDSVTSVQRGVYDLINSGFNRINIAPAYGTVVWTQDNCDLFKKALIAVALIIKNIKRINPDIEIGPIYKDSEHIKGVLSKSWGCHAGTSNIAFLPNGEIAGCSSLAMISKTIPDLVFGNVNDGIVQNKIDSFIQKARADLSVRNKCRTCAIADNCTGGCLAINYSTNQNPFDPPLIYCESIRTIEEAWEIAWGDRCLTTSSN
jgi:uncharacterized protein